MTWTNVYKESIFNLGYLLSTKRFSISLFHPRCEQTKLIPFDATTKATFFGHTKAILK